LDRHPRDTNEEYRERGFPHPHNSDLRASPKAALSSAERNPFAS
jgi:hypothetical protein